MLMTLATANIYECIVERRNIFVICDHCTLADHCSQQEIRNCSASQEKERLKR